MKDFVVCPACNTTHLGVLKACPLCSATIPAPPAPEPEEELPRELRRPWSTLPERPQRLLAAVQAADSEAGRTIIKPAGRGPKDCFAILAPLWKEVRAAAAELQQPSPPVNPAPVPKASVEFSLDGDNDLSLEVEFGAWPVYSGELWQPEQEPKGQGKTFRFEKVSALTAYTMITAMVRSLGLDTLSNREAVKLHIAEMAKEVGAF